MIAIYVRVSTSEQAMNGHSIDEQIERTKKYCDAMNWSVHKVYTDAGFTGSNMNRPALQNLIKDVKTGVITKVLVYKLDRLSRSQKDTLMLIEDIFLANGVDFVSMSENFDTSTPFGRAMIGILAVFAQLEREQIKERMAMGKLARAKQGKFHGSARIPIGYDYVDGDLIVNPYEKLQVQLIYELYAQGKSPHEIQNALDGYTHKGSPWNVKTIRDVLSRKTYLGYVGYQGQWYQGTHEPIISPELYEQVQEIRKKKRSDHDYHNRRTGRATSYFGGYLVCAHCGAKYGKSQHKTNGKVYSYYSCNSRSKQNRILIKDENCKNKIWRMEDLDNIIFNEMKKLSLQPIQEPEQHNTDGNRILNDEIRKLDDQISRLVDLYAVDGIPQDVLQERIHGLTDQKEKLKEKLTEPKAPDLDLINSIGDVLEYGDFAEIRSVIDALIEYIELDGDDVTIHWNF